MYRRASLGFPSAFLWSALWSVERLGCNQTVTLVHARLPLRKAALAGAGFARTLPLYIYGLPRSFILP